ncbi:MAG: proprotein convertase P-domain-containing protein [Pseudomonadota bacterium]
MIRTCSLFAKAIVGAAAGIVMLLAPARAQTGPYVDTASIALNGGTECTAAEIVQRTITVSDSFVIGDIDFGFVADHAWRKDIRVDLTSPLGTQVRLINGPADNPGVDDLNVRLDDDQATFVDADNAAHNAAVAPYQNDRRPDNSLSAFNGENAQGNWTVEICDNFPTADNGTYLRSELFFEEATDIDLSLDLGVSSANPPIGGTVVFTVTITNAGPLVATGVTASAALPTDFTYVSDTAGGAYNSGTGIWTAPASIGVGASTSFQITATADTASVSVMTAEIVAANEPDTDSTPNNSGSDPNEDDTDVVTITPGGTPGVPPTLSCSAGSATHDWDTNTWPAGSLSQTYAGGAQAISIAITGDTGNFVNDGGSPTPFRTNAVTGGLTPAQQALRYLNNFDNSAQSVVTTIDLGVPGTGVGGFQTTLFDIDAGGGQFVDQISVFGYLNGNFVAPVLTAGSANTVSGLSVIGTAASGGTQSAGNAVITFTQPVDQVVIAYEVGAGAPANPGNQGMAIHDFDYCLPTAELDATKIVAVYDPTIIGLFSVPGNDVTYTITVRNIGGGPADADSVFIVDALPTEIEFYTGDIDDGGPETGSIAFFESASGLTFSEVSDVGYSNTVSPPANFASCGYSPTGLYDEAVRHICFNPKGSFASGDPDPWFSVTFRARIK